VRDLLESDVMSGEMSEELSEAAGAVRAQWRADEEEWSRAALEHWEHGRTLADVARDCLHRGDQVTVAFPSIGWSGVVVGVGHDVARIDAVAGSVDVRLAADAPFVLRVHAGSGTPARRDAAVTTFTARLRELDGTEVNIGTSDAVLEGRLRVGRDQLRLTDADGASAYVPIGSVWWVRPRDDD
jgi:hypothetical protein